MKHFGISEGGFWVGLCAGWLCLPTVAGAQAITPATPAPPPPPMIAAPQGELPPLTLRNRPDGTIEKVEKGHLELIAPEDLLLSTPGPGLLQWKAEVAAETEAIEEEAVAQEEAAQEAAAEAAKKEAAAERAAEKVAAEKAALKERSVSVLNGITGAYEEIVPLDVARRAGKTGREAAARDKVVIYNKMTGSYVEGVPVSALTPAESEAGD